MLVAFSVCVWLASARVIGSQAPAHQPAVTTDVVYGQKEDGLALTLDVHRPAQPNGAGIISIVSGGWQSSVEMAQIFAQAYPPLIQKGFTVFAVRHGSWPRYRLPSIVADMRRSVRFIRQHAKEYGVIPTASASSVAAPAGPLALLLGTTGDYGDPSETTGAQGIQSRGGGRGELPPRISLDGDAAAGFKFTEAEAAQFSPIRFVSSGSVLAHRARRRDTASDRPGRDDVRGVDKAGVPASSFEWKARDTDRGRPSADLERSMPHSCSG